MVRTFGRKIDYRPLIVCIISSILIVYCLSSFSNSIYIGVAFGILTFILGIALFSLRMDDLFGCWKVSNHRIEFMDYSASKKRILALLFPFHMKNREIEIKDINSILLFIGKDIKVPDNTLGGTYFNTYSPEKILEHMSTPYYIELNMKNGEKIILDLSWDINNVTNNSDKIEETLNYISNISNSKLKIMSTVKSSQP